MKIEFGDRRFDHNAIVVLPVMVIELPFFGGMEITFAWWHWRFLLAVKKEDAP